MTIKSKELPPTKNIVHYLMYGRTACGSFEGKRPNTWVAGHLWDIHWKNVTCCGCLKYKPK